MSTLSTNVTSFIILLSNLRVWISMYFTSFDIFMSFISFIFFSYFDECHVFQCISSQKFKTLHQCKWINISTYFKIFHFSKEYFDVFWRMSAYFNTVFFPYFNTFFFMLKYGKTRWKAWNTSFNATIFQHISTYFTRMFRWWPYSTSVTSCSLRT